MGISGGHSASFPVRIYGLSTCPGVLIHTCPAQPGFSLRLECDPLWFVQGRINSPTDPLDLAWFY